MISVILIATDACDVIDATVKSVLAQTIPGWELLIVDNGSADDTAAHARRWEEYDPRIQAVSIPRTTAAMARQIGVERAAKQWITFVNAGDRMTPDALEWLSSHMTPDVSMVVGGITRSTERGSYSLHSDFSGLLSVPKFVDGLLNYDFAHDVGGKLFRHELYIVPDIISDVETSRPHQVMTVISTLPRDGQVYINTGRPLYESSDTGLDYPQVMNFRGWLKSIKVLGEYVPPTECFYLFKLRSLYRCCIMQGAMFSSSEPEIRQLRNESKSYRLSEGDRNIVKLLGSRRKRRRAWSHGTLIPAAGEILVSMIMAAYNDADLMAKAVKSLQSQTFMQWELLIIDDSSSDRTPEVMRSLGADDPRIRWIRTSKSVGRYRISRMGISAARGVYIGFFNPDDMLECRSLEKMWERAALTDADMVVMGARLISTHGWLKFTQFDPTEVFDSQVMTTHQIMGDMITGKGVPWHQYGRLYRREYLRRADMTIDDDDDDRLFNLLAMLTDGTVAWTDYQGYINLHSTDSDLPYTMQWKKLVNSFHNGLRVLELRQWAGHPEWHNDQLRALGEALIEKMSGALQLEPMGRVLKCIEDALESPKVVDALTLIGCQPTLEAVMDAAERSRKAFRKSFRRHLLLQKF